MLEGMIFLASYASFNNVFAQLEQAGVYSDVLPFLFIFAMVFGILTRTKIFENNKGINFILSLVVGLMALQTSFVSEFFAIVSPLLGIGLVILIIVVIFLGLVAPKESWFIYTIFGISAIILVNVLLNIAELTGSGWYDWWQNWSGLIIFVVVVVVIWIIANSDKDKNTGSQYDNIVPKFLKELAS
ncbi:MAG: hypothetical protein OQK82_03255 [Candidatus Pacearchaeota archaeon]|nr:hypothetical protein [Candidatus Pacearchaeota archaeon]